MNEPWISAYKQKDWIVYEVPLESEEWRKLKESLRELEDHELFVCAAESEYAADRWKQTQSVKGVLFSDIEQLWAMNLDKVYGVSQVGLLTKEWKGHPVGSLVMIVYRGVMEEPKFFTVGVATNK